MTKNAKRKLSLEKVTVATFKYPIYKMAVTDTDSVFATTATGHPLIVFSDKPSCRFYTQK